MKMSFLQEKAKMIYTKYTIVDFLQYAIKAEILFLSGKDSIEEIAMDFATKGKKGDKDMLRLLDLLAEGEETE